MTKDEKEFKAIQNFFDSEKNIDENEGKILDTNSINCIQSTDIFPRIEKEENQKGDDFGKFNLIEILALKEKNKINENTIEKKIPEQNAKKMEINENDLTDEDKRKVENQMKVEYKNLFNCKYFEKPGRKRKNENEDIYDKKVHSKIAQDNLITKIQTYFITFIISLANDIIQELTKKK